MNEYFVLWMKKISSISINAAAFHTIDSCIVFSFRTSALKKPELMIRERQIKKINMYREIETAK